jgi:hypothetical protein
MVAVDPIGRDFPANMRWQREIACAQLVRQWSRCLIKMLGQEIQQVERAITFQFGTMLKTIQQKPGLASEPFDETTTENCLE